MSENQNRRSFLKKSFVTSAGIALGLGLKDESSLAKTPKKLDFKRSGKKIISREEAREALTGPMMSLRTPFLANGEIDYQGIRNIIDFTIDGGTKAIITTWGDTLYSILTDEEIAILTKFVVEHTAGRAMVVAADRSWWTGKEVEYAKYVRDVGADMLMVLPPNWVRSCTVDTFVEHYAAVAEHIPVMVVTNVFKGYPISMSMEVLKRLCDVEGVYAVKDDLCGEFGRRLGLTVSDHIAAFCGGTKRLFLNSYPYGCTGYFSVFIEFKPSVAQEFWCAVQTNDSIKIRNVIKEYELPLWDYIGNFTGSFSAAIGGIQELAGLSQRWRRKPYYSLNDDEMEKMGGFFKSKGWL